MRTGPPEPGDPQRGNGHRGAAAASWPAARSPDARRARLTAFWALVLRLFRDYANRGPHPDAGLERPAEEDR